MMFRPYLETASNQELFCVVVGGLSSLAGAAMILFRNWGVNIHLHILSIFHITGGRFFFL